MKKKLLLLLSLISVVAFTGCGSKTNLDLDEVQEELTKLAEAYKMEIDKVKELMGNREIEAIKMDLAVGKAVDFVTDAAVEA